MAAEAGSTICKENTEGYFVAIYIQVVLTKFFYMIPKCRKVLAQKQIQIRPKRP